MLFPVSTDRPLRRGTVVTFALIGACVMIFAVQAAWLRSDPTRWREVLEQIWLIRSGFRWWMPLTSAFLHGGWFHLLMNMLFLWAFGPNVEDRFGRVGFLAFYLVGAYAAGALHVAMSASPAIGASGAIAAVTGAYLVLFPRTSIRCFYILTAGMVWVPAWYIIAFGVLWDFFAPMTGQGGNIAHFAHLGGYAWGISLSLFLLWARFIPREQYDLFTMGRQAYRRKQIRSAAAEAQRAVKRRAESVAVPETAARLDSLAAARAEVGSLIAAGQHEQAARAYLPLVDRFGDIPGAATLSRQYMYDIANQLFRDRQYTPALAAYERFIEAYRTDPHVPSIRLMAALICVRYVRDPQRARRMLDGLETRLHDTAEKQMAQELSSELAGMPEGADRPAAAGRDAAQQ
ncbi:MAG: rhomboid family intramembrane serine protease [Phycisphaeraceae bacterium]|nr:rhomboid family intramembrane serine protease [Phycisphaeraceae bacterium]